MALPKVVIIPGKGNTGQQGSGEDYISGMVFYTNSLPSGFTSGARNKELFAISDAEAAGILNDYSDETQATASALISNAGATGDKITLSITEADGTVITLGSYTNLSSDTIEIVVDELAAAINLQTSQTGYSAADAGDTETTVVITARKGLGIGLNSGTPLTKVVTGAMAATLTQFSGGVASLLAIWHYHISEFFRLNPAGVTFVGFYAVPVSAVAYTYAEVSTLQAFAQGKIRQFSVYAPKNYAASASDALTFIGNACDLLQAQYTAMFNLHQPASIIFSTDLTHVVNVSAINLDLSAKADNRVSVTIGQDGANVGYHLWLATGYSITDIGAVLGVTSLAHVSEDIGDLSQFNMTNGAELSVPAFATGELVKNISATLQNNLDNLRYIFLVTYQGYSGVFINNDHVAAPFADSWGYIHFGRTWDKASRLLYAAYLPFLKAKFSLNANGTLSPTTQATLTQAGSSTLDGMVRDQDLSGFTVTVPTNQNPNTTGKLLITVNLLAEAIANEIDITSTFVASL